jgi:uncharacterized protein (DUF1778 family)
MSTKANKDSRIAVRLSALEKQLIEQAAQHLGETVTEFTVRCILDQARDIILDQTQIVFNEEQWEAFVKQLEEPPQVHTGLVELFKTPSVFDS